MLISYYLSSNMDFHLFYDLTHFRELGQKYKKYFPSYVFGSNKDLKFATEIY